MGYNVAVTAALATSEEFHEPDLPGIEVRPLLTAKARPWRCRAVVILPRRHPVHPHSEVSLQLARALQIFSAGIKQRKEETTSLNIPGVALFGDVNS